VGLYGDTISSLTGNVITANTVGIFLEGAETKGTDPAPRINDNEISGNSVVNRPTALENIVLNRFGAVQSRPIDARRNFFRLMTEAEIRASIVNRGTAPVVVDISGFVTSRP
jgi:hypothetical protein